MKTGVILVVVLAFGAAPLASQSPPAAARPARDVLQREQLLALHFQNVYDAIENLRSNWLQERGPMTFQKDNPVVIQVYFDAVRLGGVATLKEVSVREVATIRHLSGIEATARYGVGHAAGAIQILTWPVGAPVERDSP